ncbi:hypothetical protein D3C87_1991870 [compost metagenome]
MPEIDLGDLRMQVNEHGNAIFLRDFVKLLVTGIEYQAGFADAGIIQLGGFYSVLDGLGV